MSTTEPLIEVINMKKHYTHSKFNPSTVLRAVDGIHLSINKGETVGLVGESGCGKSTLGQLIGQLLSPSEGTLLFDGTDISTLSKNEKKLLRKDIQYVFQDAYSSLNPRHRISQLLAEPLIIQGIRSKTERKQLIKEILDWVGLDSSYLNRYIHELSGGQRQRIGIARSLILKPKFLILDEPVSALDVSIQSQILNLLIDMQKQFSLTYLFISHDLNVVHFMSDRVAVMYLGKIVEVAETRTLYENPLHPYTKALVSAIPSHHKHRERIMLNGEIPNPLDLPKGCSFHTRCPYVQDICLSKLPQLTETKSNQYVRCHLV